MELYPAIDLQKGCCVRLRQGDFDAATCYDGDPLAVAKRFEDEGAENLHIVDLDGAQAGIRAQAELIAKIAQSTTLRVQVGGGVRSEEDIRELLALGVSRVVIGSLAVSDPGLVGQWIGRYSPERFLLAFDVKVMDDGSPIVLTRGWQEASDQTLWEALAKYRDLPAIMCTDVQRDGMMTGANVSLYKKLKEALPGAEVIASGGIGSLEDIKALSRITDGAILGRALYENKFTLAQALEAAKESGDAG